MDQHADASDAVGPADGALVDQWYRSHEYYYNCHYLCDEDAEEELMPRLRRNDAEITGVCLLWDWIRRESAGPLNLLRDAGEVIGENTQVRALRVQDFPEESAGALAAFFERLCKNRSINTIVFDDEHLDFSAQGVLALHPCLHLIRTSLASFFKQNSNLRCIEITNCRNLDYGSLVSALKECNSLLTRFILDGLDTGIGDVETEKVARALDKQGNLEVLKLTYETIGIRGVRSIAELLQSSWPKLIELNIGPYVGCNDDFDDDCMSSLTHALAKHHTLKRFRVGGLETRRCISSPKWCELFSSVVRRPTCSLQKLWLSYNSIDDAGMAELGRSLAVNQSMLELHLGHCRHASSIGWRDFSVCLRSSTSSLEELRIDSCNIEDDGAVAILSSLAGNLTLKSLNISENATTTRMGWRRGFNSLRNSDLCLEELVFIGNNVDDEGVEALVDVFTRNPTLKELNILECPLISSAGLSLFANLVRHPRSVLHKFDLQNSDRLNDAVLIDFANALAGNTSLEEIRGFSGGMGHMSHTRYLNRTASDSDSDGEPSITDRGWAALSKALCDTSSIDSTFSSNHTLCRGFGYMPGADFVSSLEMNSNSNKKEVARQKILMRHFWPDNNIQAFTSLEWKVLPRAIEWIGRDHLGSSLLYQLTRSMPSLCESSEKTNALAGTKRRRIAEP